MVSLVWEDTITQTSGTALLLLFPAWLRADPFFDDRVSESPKNHQKPGATGNAAAIILRRWSTSYKQVQNERMNERMNSNHVCSNISQRLCSEGLRLKKCLFNWYEEFRHINWTVISWFDLWTVSLFRCNVVSYDKNSSTSMCASDDDALHLWRRKVY